MKRRHLPVTMACPNAKKHVCTKKKKIHLLDADTHLLVNSNTRDRYIAHKLQKRVLTRSLISQKKYITIKKLNFYHITLKFYSKHLFVFLFLHFFARFYLFWLIYVSYQVHQLFTCLAWTCCDRLVFSVSWTVTTELVYFGWRISAAPTCTDI